MARRYNARYSRTTQRYPLIIGNYLRVFEDAEAF